MRNILTFFLMICAITPSPAQNKDRIKGSRTVTIAEREIATFKNIEVADNIEIFLVRGQMSALEIEADENLHETILSEVIGGNLILGTANKVTSSKKLSVKITYTGDIEMITIKDDVVATTIDKMEVANLTVKSLGSAKFLGTIASTTFSLIADDKTKTELNVTSDKTVINLSKNSALKALISSSAMTFDMYQKSSAEIEGDVLDLTLRLENNASFIGKKLTTSNCALMSDSYTKCSIFVDKTISIEASGKTEIDLLGAPKIEIRNFADNAVLAKK